MEGRLDLEALLGCRSNTLTDPEQSSSRLLEQRYDNWPLKLQRKQGQIRERLSFLKCTRNGNNEKHFQVQFTSIQS